MNLTQSDVREPRFAAEGVPQAPCGSVTEREAATGTVVSLDVLIGALGPGLGDRSFRPQQCADPPAATPPDRRQQARAARRRGSRRLLLT